MRVRFPRKLSVVAWKQHILTYSLRLLSLDRLFVVQLKKLAKTTVLRLGVWVLFRQTDLNISLGLEFDTCDFAQRYLVLMERAAASRVCIRLG